MWYPASTAKDNSNTVTCTPAAAISTAGKYSLKATSAKVGGTVTLTVDEEASKTLTIDPNYTEESGNTNKDESGNFHKFSSFLLIDAGLLLSITFKFFPLEFFLKNLMK